MGILLFSFLKGENGSEFNTLFFVSLGITFTLLGKRHLRFCSHLEGKFVNCVFFFLTFTFVEYCVAIGVFASLRSCTHGHSQWRTKVGGSKRIRYPRRPICYIKRWALICIFSLNVNILNLQNFGLSSLHLCNARHVSYGLEWTFHFKFLFIVCKLLVFLYFFKVLKTMPALDFRSFALKSGEM